jgi:hypothetical protein
MRCGMRDSNKIAIAAMEAFEKTSAEMRDLIEIRERIKLVEEELDAARGRGPAKRKKEIRP